MVVCYCLFLGCVALPASTAWATCCSWWRQPRKQTKATHVSAPSLHPPSSILHLPSSIFHPPYTCTSSYDSVSIIASLRTLYALFGGHSIDCHLFCWLLLFPPLKSKTPVPRGLTYTRFHPTPNSSPSPPSALHLRVSNPSRAQPRAVEMPPINHAAISAGVVVASMAVAAAIAIYESPELQRMANDLRRKIAIALHSLGDGILPENANGEPLFNRPEDAEGFLQSAEVDADDETRRRQREELMYWNALKLSKELDKHTAENEKRKSSTGSATTFDDFLEEDKHADEKGTYVFNTGADVRNHDEGLVRRRGLSEGVRGLNASLYANPFADEHGIDYDEQMEESHIAPEKDEEVFSDIYNATPRETPASLPSRTMTPVSMPDLIPIEPEPMPPVSDREIFSQTKSVSQQSDSATASSRPESTIPEFEYATAGQDQDNQQHDAYASIQAWAQQQQQQSGMDFYSPLPVTPNAPLSEMSDGELLSEGQLTPTDSASVAESGVDIANELASHDGSASVNHFDVMSEDEDGIATPAHSWTEVGSVVSESEDGMQQHAQRA